jgi:hypothetical protein
MSEENGQQEDTAAAILTSATVTSACSNGPWIDEDVLEPSLPIPEHRRLECWLGCMSNDQLL